MNVQARQYPVAPRYVQFFEPLEISFNNPAMLEYVQFAYICSKYGHALQVRDGGGRYFDHPKGAAWIYIYELGGRDPRIVALLLLHDLREDAYLLSYFRISLNFGKDMALDVQAVTKHPNETVEEYLERVINQGKRTILAKLCDRLHNVRTLDGCTLDKRKRYVKETQKYYLPILIPALRSFGGIWETYADQLEALLNEALEPYLAE